MNPKSSLGHREPEVPGHVARGYVRRGWSVLPLWWPARGGACACGLDDCESAAKHPIRRLVPHGLRDATNRLETVDEWWRSHPTANVAIRTGEPGGPIVLDIDGALGELALRGLVAHHGPFQALWVRTGSGGWHAYFAHPGTPVRNSAGRAAEGLDVRGDSGYVVAPPSRHASLRRYRWVAPGADGDLPEMPSWLVELVAPPEGEEVALPPVRLRSDDTRAYAAAALEREAREVAEAPPGQRNDRLNRAAFKLGQLVGAGLVGEAVVMGALVAAGLAAGPGEHKIRSTVRSGLQAGMRQPRRVTLRGPRGERDTC